VDYYLKYLKYYFTNYFYIKYIYYLVTGEYKAWMENAFTDPAKRQKMGNKEGAGKFRNESDETEIESEMAKNFEQYYRTHDFSRPKITRPEFMHPDDMNYLRKMKAIFEMHGTDYRFIIGPNYIHERIPSFVTDSLTKIFGAGKVYDFSGYSFTGADTLFYMEHSHYTSKLGQLMLREVYR